MIEEKDVLALVHFKAQVDVPKGTAFLRSEDPLFGPLFKNGTVAVGLLKQKAKIVDKESDLIGFALNIDIESVHGPIKNLCYSKALFMVKKGYRICRESWNGVNQWIRLVNPHAPHPDAYKAAGEDVSKLKPGIVNPYFKIADNNEFAEGTMVSWLGIKTTQNLFVPWVASQTDTLAEDWIVLPN